MSGLIETLLEWVKDWRFWAFIFSTIFVGLKMEGIHLLKGYPHFEIDFVFKEHENKFILTRTTDVAPIDCRLFYTVPQKYKFVEIKPIDRIRRALSKEKVAFINFTPFDPELEKSIIWKVGYYLHSFWIYQYECFDWDGKEWVSRQWNGIYTTGWGRLLFIKHPIRDKAKRQIKIWKNYEI